MNNRQKRYLKLNLMSLFFIGVSFISITLAWFAYSGLVTTSTEINVKAWYIEFQKDNQAVSNKIVISLDDISPGMQTISEKINIKNMGDSDAALSYEITSARILDETITNNNEFGYLEDKLSHDYPFHINISLADPYANANDGTSEFEVSVSWPLDSDNDKSDSEWGNKAYNFYKSELLKQQTDKAYQIRPTLKVEISLKAVQYIEDDSSTDPNYKLGDIVLYDYQKNEKCSAISTSCIKSYVIDKDNKIGDKTVTLLPDLYNNYTSSTSANYNTKLNELISTWDSTLIKTGLKAEDVLTIVSKDVSNSVLIRPNISNEVIGYLDYNNRMTNHINKTISYSGYYRFLNELFPYFNTSKCYWLNTTYNNDYQFALQKIDDTYSKVYNEEKNKECSIAPKVKVSKEKLK